jgi:hypothetical protein
MLTETFHILRRNEQDKIKMYIGIHLKLLLFLSDFNDTWVFLTDFQRNTIIKIHENPSSGSWDVPCWQTDRQTDMILLTVAF